jgi:SH3 domain (SH3b1 type)
MNIRKRIFASRMRGIARAGVSHIGIIAFAGVLLVLTPDTGWTQNPPAFANQSPRPPAQPGQERHFLRAPDVLPGTLPEMRTAAYWIAGMPHPDEVVIGIPKIRQMNLDFTERVRHPGRIDSLARQLILAKIDAYPGLFFSQPDPFTQTPAQRASAVRSIIDAEIKYMRHTEYGNILGIQYSNGELDRLEAEMSAATIDNQQEPVEAMAVEAVDLRIVPMISPEYVGQSDKNRTRWDVWNLDIVDIGTPVQILHASKSGGFLFVLCANGYGWVPAEKIAITSRAAAGRFVDDPHFVICTGDKVPFFAGPDGKYASGWFRMGDRLPLAPRTPNSPGGAASSTTASHALKILVPVRQADGSLSVQAAWLVAGSDVQVGYLPYTRKNVVLQSLKLLDNIYDWTGAWMGRNHATALRDIFGCFGFHLPSCGELLSVYTDHPKFLSAKESRDLQYQAVLANDPFTTLQVCSSGHSQLYLGNYRNVPIVYDTHGYNYTDSTGKTFDIRRSCIETIALPDYFLKQDVTFIELR